MSFEIFCSKCKLNKPALKMTKGILTATCTCGNSAVIYAATTTVNNNAFVMPFGKYKGESVADIVASDPGYAEWAIENLQDPKIRERFEKELRG